MPCHGRCFIQSDDDGDVYMQIVCKENPPCGLHKCPNYPVCGKAVPQYILSCRKGFCFDCKETFGRELTFFHSAEPCPVCWNENWRSVKYACGHYLCVECFGKATQYKPADISKVNAADFGCVMPERPDGISDIEWEDSTDDVLAAWRQTNPIQYAAYEYAMDNVLLLADLDNRTRKESVRRCPICRCEDGIFANGKGAAGRGYHGSNNLLRIVHESV